MSTRANIAAIALALATACGGSNVSPPSTASDTPTFTDGKADQFGEPTVLDGACASEAPAVPYQPVPEGTRAQPDGPNVLHTRVGVSLPIDFERSTPLRGEFRRNDCGRHYFTFTLSQAARLTIIGESLADGEATPLDLCFVQPSFLRLDTPWYSDIWARAPHPDAPPPCGTFVPVGQILEPAEPHALEFGAGVYELTIDPQMGAAIYDLELAFAPIGNAVCGDGVRDPGEGCDDGNQHPLDWCGADCRPQRLDIEPLDGNETAASAQSLDGFRRINFYAPAGDKEVDVYRLELAAGETVELTRGERICRNTYVQLYRSDGAPIAEPWDCASMAATPEFAATHDGTYYLRFETAAEGARSVSARILP